jgi:hypothetical protein
MADEGWEARMATRAAQRREERPQDSWNWEAVIEYRRRHAAAVSYIRSSQTLGGAMTWLDGGFACACSGDPCCKDWYTNALALHRGAHIVARLLSDAVLQPPNDPERTHQGEEPWRPSRPSLTVKPTTWPT